MAIASTATVHTLKYKVRAIIADHEAMLLSRKHCSNPTNCRWKVANHRALAALNLGLVTKVWVDAGHIRFTLDGWRYSADTPKAIKGDLIRLDKWLQLSAQKRATTPIPFDPNPHTVTAIRGARARTATAEEKKKMADRRRKRVIEGRPDAPRPLKHTFHDRVVGYA
jgi:hypothetical protein